jgi:hypothetical protein
VFRTYLEHPANCRFRLTISKSDAKTIFDKIL